jgi:transcriptional regulator with XRE-family HTH domain
MPGQERAVDRGARSARADLARVGTEIRVARLGAGLALSVVADAVGMSAAQISRIERGRVPTANVWQLGRIGAIVGLDIRVRSFPGPDPLRDAGQIRLLERLRSRLHPSLTLRLEVPLPIAGDARAWDGWIAGFVAAAERNGMPVEAETRIVDMQAQVRRITLKMRDASVDHVLVVVAETPANRRAIAAAAPILAGTFPVPARQSLAALGVGRHPGGSALLFV